jgi:hypothetical protein
MSMLPTLLSPDRQMQVPWKNGGGVSTVIADERLPGFAAGDWEGVVWQLSRTAIIAPGPFSDLAGFERLQTVIGGEGLYLDAPDGAIDLSQPLTIARYDGGTAIISRLTHGAVEVVNLIARKDKAWIDMRVMRAGDTLSASDGRTLLYAPIGPASLMLAGELLTLPRAHAWRLDRPADVRCAEGIVLAAMISRRRAS